MPELPDVVVYLEALGPRVLRQALERFRIGNPFLVRTIEPPPAQFEGRRVTSLRRMGKRLVFGFEEELFLVLHLMIAGRLRWRDKGKAIPGKVGLAAFDFPTGTLLLTEQRSKRQASHSPAARRGRIAGVRPRRARSARSRSRGVRRSAHGENHTLKRSLTDPTIFSGIGNAYSDEILHAAKLSPMKQTRQLSDAEISRLHDATVATLETWVARTRDEVGDGFPEKVTAFREGMAVHGRYGKPCPVCASPVQRIVYAHNECNYCATCQTEGRLLSDRALSRLLKQDWPKTLEEMEQRKN